VTRMDSSLTKGVLNFPPRYMLKHVSGDTDVDTTIRNIKQLYGCLYALSPFLLLKTYLLVWAVVRIYDRKWPVQ
jgi:hypothetical protein